MVTVIIKGREISERDGEMTNQFLLCYRFKWGKTEVNTHAGEETRKQRDKEAESPY